MSFEYINHFPWSICHIKVQKGVKKAEISHSSVRGVAGHSAQAPTTNTQSSKLVKHKSSYLDKVIPYFSYLRVQSFQTQQLIGYSLWQGADCGVLDISQQVLHSDFFGLLGPYFTWDVLKCFWCRWPVLKYSHLEIKIIHKKNVINLI